MIVTVYQKSPLYNLNWIVMDNSNTWTLAEANRSQYFSEEGFSEIRVRSTVLNQLAHFYRGRNVLGCLWTLLYVTNALNTFTWEKETPPSALSSYNALRLTVLLVHQYFKWVHLIILKRQSHFFCSVVVCELPIHEAGKHKGKKTN